MEVYTHEDQSVKQFLDKIANYTRLAKTMNLPYWIFISDSNPVGVVTIGREPIQLLAPIGTPMAVIQMTDTKMPAQTIEEFARREQSE
jgi:hypothetical protein